MQWHSQLEPDRPALPVIIVSNGSMQPSAGLDQEPELQHEGPLQPAPHHRSCASTATQCGAQPMVATAALQAGHMHSEHQQQTEQPESSYSLPESLVDAAIKELEGQADRYCPS